MSFSAADRHRHEVRDLRFPGAGPESGDEDVYLHLSSEPIVSIVSPGGC